VVAAAFWFAFGMVVARSLALWAAALAIFLGPLLLLTALALGLRMRPFRRGVISGAMWYSAVFLAPVVAAVVSDLR
jgi:hypothetical protein